MKTEWIVIHLNSMEVVKEGCNSEDDAFDWLCEEGKELEDYLVKKIKLP